MGLRACLPLLHGPHTSHLGGAGICEHLSPSPKQAWALFLPAASHTCLKVAVTSEGQTHSGFGTSSLSRVGMDHPVPRLPGASSSLLSSFFSSSPLPPPWRPSPQPRMSS